MAVPRILSGRALLDKLPYWLALPVGLFVGLFAGYRASVPEVGMKRMALAGGVLLAAALFAWLAPRPARRGMRRMAADEPTSANAEARAPAVTDDDSLCG